jgi:energy-coupling factor transport system ATP-binding protein
MIRDWSERRTERRGRRRTTELTLLRPVPGNSPVHALWAGTKILSVAAISLVLSIRPTWPAIGVLGGFVLASLILARIPPGAAPRLPRWFWIALFLGAALTLRSNKAPIVHVGALELSMGGLDQWARYTVLAAVILAGAALVSWTTPLAEVAPALSRLGTPLRWLRLPVDEWAIASALSIRCLPLLTDEIRTLAAARRLRAREPEPGVGRLTRALIEARDLLLAALTVSLRRAHELGDAIEARGGFGLVSDTRSRPRPLDGLALLVVAGVAAAALLV